MAARLGQSAAPSKPGSLTRCFSFVVWAAEAVRPIGASVCVSKKAGRLPYTRRDGPPFWRSSRGESFSLYDANDKISVQSVHAATSLQWAFRLRWCLRIERNGSLGPAYGDLRLERGSGLIVLPP